MERVTIADGLDFSRIVYGMWRVGDDADTSPKHVRAKIDACLEQGITTIDQADIYGGYTAEAIFGAALKEDKSLRDKLDIVTKCGIVVDAGRHAGASVKHYDTSPKHIAASLEASLADMGTDRVDLLLIHRPDPMMDHEATGRALDEAVSSGKARSVGVSNFRPYDWDLLQSAMSQKLVTNQIELSLSAHEAFVNGDVAFHQQHGHAMMAWSPLGGGGLMVNGGDVAARMDDVAKAQGVDRAAVAVAWLLAHPATILPVMGTNTLSRIKTLSDALKVEMDRQTWFQLYEAALGREVA